MVIIFGCIFFDNMNESESKHFKTNNPSKALIRSIELVIKCNTQHELHKAIDSLENTFDGYLIPDIYEGEIGFETPLVEVQYDRVMNYVLTK